MQNQVHECSPAIASLSDDGLVKLSQEGDQSAFAELVRRHHPACAKLAFSILREKESAEDEVQNALWKAFQHIRQFQSDSKFSTWLTRIVVNQCLIQLRKARRARFFYIDDVQIGDETGRLELRDSRKNPEKELGQAEVAAALHNEIRRIPPLLRNVFLLREVQRLPMTDVAERLGISVAAAKSRLLRARSELRIRMGKHGGRSGPAVLMAG